MKQHNLGFTLSSLSHRPHPTTHSALSRGHTWGLLPRCLEGCWVRQKDKQQLFLLPSITLELHGEAVPTPPHIHPPPTPSSRGLGGFLGAELAHLNLSTRRRTLQTPQVQLVLLALA